MLGHVWLGRRSQENMKNARKENKRRHREAEFNAQFRVSDVVKKSLFSSYFDFRLVTRRQRRSIQFTLAKLFQAFKPICQHGK